MVRRLKVPKLYRRLMADGGHRRFLQIMDLQLGPVLLSPVESEQELADAYERQPRRGFNTYSDMQLAWERHGEELMAEYVGFFCWA